MFNYEQTQTQPRLHPDPCGKKLVWPSVFNPGFRLIPRVLRRYPSSPTMSPRTVSNPRQVNHIHQMRRDWKRLVIYGATQRVHIDLEDYFT